MTSGAAASIAARASILGVSKEVDRRYFALKPSSPQALVSRVASKGARQARPARGSERHCTCRVDWAISPLESPSAASDRARMRSAGSSLLQMHYAADSRDYREPDSHTVVR